MIRASTCAPTGLILTLDGSSSWLGWAVMARCISSAVAAPDLYYSANVYSAIRAGRRSIPFFRVRGKTWCARSTTG
jgi:hypothetical protein